MKERGILFNGSMVRAILEGRKTQTRRIVRKDNADLIGWFCSTDEVGIGDTEYLGQRAEEKGLRIWCSEYPEEGSEVIAAQFGMVGDVIWVRETFALEHRVNYGQEPPFNDGRPIKYDEYTWMQPHYRATDPTPELDYEDGDGPKVKWTPSIHMPRWASRINLEITGVRVERLTEISEGDAKAEGYPGDIINGINYSVGSINWYRGLWESINGAGSWDKNPFVWVIEFRRG